MFGQKIDDEASLAEFRREQLAARRITPVIKRHAVTLINPPVGTGKSHTLDDLLDYYGTRPEPDLIVVLAELKASLAERRLLRAPNPQVRHLRPRPRDRCGPLDAEWCVHEQNGTAAYAKAHLCKRCPKSGGCFWPGQYGKALKGGRFIMGTHQHLLLNPRFLIHVRAMTDAKNVALFLDEAGVLMAPFRRTLHHRELAEHRRAVERASLPVAVRNEWIRLTTLISQATTEDLRSPGWIFPYPSPSHAVAIQEAGLAMNPGFKWLGYDAYAFSKSRCDSRWRDHHGNVKFVCTPYLAENTVILTAGMRLEYVQRQLGVEDVVAPFARIVCQHRGTEFYNICSLVGAAANFRKNHPQILDFFGLLVIANIQAGKRTLLIARKRFKRLCAEYLTKRLGGWGHVVTIQPSDGEPPEADSPTTIPLIHFGINGINCFAAYDAAYCLTSYLIDEEVLRMAIADVESDDLRFPVEIRLLGWPRRRQAGTFKEWFLASNADETARTYYHQLETNQVIQAVGRVRFATKPRQVITLQPSDMPGVEITREFAGLREAREHFGLPTGSEHDRQRQEERAYRLRTIGRTTAKIARELGVSERTVRNRLRAWRERKRS